MMQSMDIKMFLLQNPDLLEEVHSLADSDRYDGKSTTLAVDTSKALIEERSGQEVSRPSMVIVIVEIRNGLF